MKITELEVDTKRENEGDWIESPEFPGLWAKVRSLRNPDFRRAQQTEMRRVRRKYGNQPVPVDVEDSITSKLVADHVLLDISGLEDSNDQPIKLDKDFAHQIMSDAAYRKLADFIVWAASVVGEGLNDEIEEDAGNSSSGSNGTRSGDSTKKR